MWDFNLTEDEDFDEAESQVVGSSLPTGTILGTVATTFFFVYDHDEEAFQVIKGYSVNGNFTEQQREVSDLAMVRTLISKFGNETGRAWLEGKEIEEAPATAPNPSIVAITELVTQLAEYESRLNVAQRRITDLEGDCKAKAQEVYRLTAHTDALWNKLQDVKRDAGGVSDERFKAAKRAFARLYHPNNSSVQGIEKMIRAEVFKEFWETLESIEEGKLSE